MARMRNDRDRAALLDQLLSNHIYGDEDTPVNAYPGGEDETREVEQRDINRAMPARVGSPSRKLNRTMEGYDNIKREAPPGTDADLEATEQLEEEGAESFNQPSPRQAPPNIPKANDMFTPVVPPRRGGGRPRGAPVEADDANFGNEMSSNEQMVPVPKRIVDRVMASMMQSASRNSIGRSMGSDGSDMEMPPRRRG